MSDSVEFNPITLPEQYVKAGKGSGLQPIEVTRYLDCDLGNTWKYLTRCEFKGAKCQDMGKALWYLDDYRNHFIDYNNDSTIVHNIPAEIVDKMCKFIELTEQPEIKHILEQVMMIATQNGILDPKLLDQYMFELEEYRKTFLEYKPYK